VVANGALQRHYLGGSQVTRIDLRTLDGAV
jgi:hypothetical protein